MASTLTINQIHERAQEEVTFNGEKLSVHRAYLWRDSMPMIITTDADRERIRHPRPAHLALKIKRASAIDGSSIPPSSPHSFHGVHVIRTNPGLAATSATDAPEDTHFSWRPSTDFANLSDIEISRSTQRGEAQLKIDVQGEGTEIAVSAWNGPRFGGNDVEYVVIAELPGDIFLKSKTEKMQSVC